MKALLLAAGYGKRLRPLTNTVPKCLVPINGKPLLEIWIETLVEAGITEFLINTHYLYEQVEDFIYKSKYKNIITTVHEVELLNTGGTILHNKAFFGKKESFMVIHADNLSLCNYKYFIHSHKNRNNKMLMSMMLFSPSELIECGTVLLDKKGIVIDFKEKSSSPLSNLANGAVYIFEYSIFKVLKNLNKKSLDLSVDIIPTLLGKINTFQNTSLHIDIGTKERYNVAKLKYEKYIRNKDSV